MTLARGVAIVGALIALAGFFLAWVDYQNGSFSGAAMASRVTAAGGLRGFDVALYLVPVLALATVVLAYASSRAIAADVEARLRLLGAAAAVTGLAIALLFLGSAVLGGAPGVQFQPALVRTDSSVTAAVPKAINAGAFIGVSAGVFLTILGFLASAVGAIMQRPSTPEAEARVAWRTQDYVLVAVLAVVFGAVYWAWLQPYLWIEPIAAQPGQELFFAVWFTSGLLGGYVIRRPGAAFLTETLTGAAEVLLGAPAGPVLVITAMMEALGAELVFAATGYKRWGFGTMVIAGAAAALVALPWNWFRLGYFALDPTFLILLLAIRLFGGVIAGAASKVLGDLLAATGSLNYFAIGRERVREV
jgi:energy-coupling factor transport system substrate-specific component